MRKVLFVIGCVLFFWSLLLFVVWGTNAVFFDEEFGRSHAKDLNKNVYITTVFFFVGTYLVSNNKPEEK
jgi:hypothetical protein